jgi:hypothetical protein
MDAFFEFLQSIFAFIAEQIANIIDWIISLIEGIA